MDKQHQSTCGFISGKVFKPEWERIVPFMPAFKCLKIIDFSYKQMIIASETFIWAEVKFKAKDNCKVN